ncbi:type VII secretion protein EccB [Actinomycetes bacterium KLBMP 9797]
MPSRQDQLQSYQFLVQRVVAALVARDIDPARSPFHRLAGGTLAGVLLAAIAFGAVAAHAAVTGGDRADWGDPRAIVVEKESGARFVFRGGALHPVPNYASALLIAGGAGTTVLVSRADLRGAPRGVPLGIAGAPDALPDAARLAGHWTVCGAADGGALVIGRPAGGGAPLAGRALLAEHPDGTAHLIWQHRRHAIAERDLVAAALGWADERPVRIPAPLLDALPAGSPLARAAVPGEGTPSPAVPGAVVGEVFVVATQGGGREYAVAHRAGLAAITQVQADLLLTDLDQDRPTALSQGEYADLPKVPAPAPPGAPPPATTPALAPAGGAVCGEIGDGGTITEVRVGARPPEAPVTVAPGSGALVASGGAVALVTDLGQRHAITDPSVLALLGYADVRPLRMPSALVEWIPEGPPLDPAAAPRPLTP